MDLQVDALGCKNSISVQLGMHTYIYHRDQLLNQLNLHEIGDQTQLACKSELDQSEHKPSKYSAYPKKWPTGLSLLTTLFL